MEKFISEMTRMAIAASERGDREGAKQLIELAAQAQRARTERLNAVLALVERLERLIDQGGATEPDQAPATEPGV
jgi:hypothetical protein